MLNDIDRGFSRFS